MEWTTPYVYAGRISSCYWIGAGLRLFSAKINVIIYEKIWNNYYPRKYIFNWYESNRGGHCPPLYTCGNSLCMTIEETATAHTRSVVLANDDAPIEMKIEK